MTGRMRGLRGMVAAASLAGALALAGCSAGSPSISSSASELLRSTVVAVADRAANGDIAGASSELDMLEQRLQRAVDSGDVSTERAETIRGAMETVRADLATLSAVPAAEEQPQTTETATDPSAETAVDTGDQTQPADQTQPGDQTQPADPSQPADQTQPVTEPAPAPAAPVDTEPADGGKNENAGPGNNNGNGNGNGNNGGGNNGNGGGKGKNK